MIKKDRNRADFFLIPHTIVIHIELCTLCCGDYRNISSSRIKCAELSLIENIKLQYILFHYQHPMGKDL